MNDDQKLEADQLPSGFVPLWFDIKKKGEMSRREILEKISELEEIAGLSVTVLYDDEDSSAKQFCDEIKWKYRDCREDQVPTVPWSQSNQFFLISIN